MPVAFSSRVLVANFECPLEPIADVSTLDWKIVARLHVQSTERGKLKWRCNEIFKYIHENDISYSKEQTCRSENIPLKIL
jgi:hypothetical protein